ncbi:hypothetical protein niasHT_017356 [Heterodera trifolii]|uniref:Uncharacterized protein n=1 Tax=Heterodera trifolii TaxID=157864 RepID=A0ABD2L4C6_9BILA
MIVPPFPAGEETEKTERLLFFSIIQCFDASFNSHQFFSIPATVARLPGVRMALSHLGAIPFWHFFDVRRLEVCVFQTVDLHSTAINLVYWKPSSNELNFALCLLRYWRQHCHLWCARASAVRHVSQLKHAYLSWNECCGGHRRQVRPVQQPRQRRIAQQQAMVPTTRLLLLFSMLVCLGMLTVIVLLMYKKKILLDKKRQAAGDGTSSLGASVVCFHGNVISFSNPVLDDRRLHQQSSSSGGSGELQQQQHDGPPSSELLHGLNMTPPLHLRTRSMTMGTRSATRTPPPQLATGAAAVAPNLTPLKRAKSTHCLRSITDK